MSLFASDGSEIILTRPGLFLTRKASLQPISHTSPDRYHGPSACCDHAGGNRCALPTMAHDSDRFVRRQLMHTRGQLAYMNMPRARNMPTAPFIRPPHI